jgi:hypothetical protein
MRYFLSVEGLEALHWRIAQSKFYWTSTIPLLKSVERDIGTPFDNDMCCRLFNDILLSILSSSLYVGILSNARLRSLFAACCDTEKPLYTVHIGYISDTPRY